jgi:hypothetical protein
MRISDIVREGAYGKFVRKNEDGTYDVADGSLHARTRVIKIIDGKVYALNPEKRWRPSAPEWRETFAKITIPETEFFSTTTDIPMYDDMMRKPDYFFYEKGLKAEVKLMTPREYISTCARGRGNYGISYDEEARVGKPNLVAKYASSMLRGDKFPVPIIEYDKKGRIDQEGRHRALAVQKLIDDGYVKRSYRMPILIIKAV